MSALDADVIKAYVEIGIVARWRWDAARDNALQMVPSGSCSKPTPPASRFVAAKRGFACRFVQLCVQTSARIPGDDAVYPVLFRSISTAEMSINLKHLQ